MKVQFVRAATLGIVEENFVARLRPGDVFTFAGRTLEFVRVRGMVAYVRKTTSKRSNVPHWSGARMPISPQLAAWIRIKLDEARQGVFLGPEMAAVRPILELQERWSRLPARRAADRAGRDPRGPPPLLLPDRRPPGARGAGRPVRVPAGADRPDLLHPRGERLRPRAAVRRPRAARRGPRSRTALAGICCTTFPRASTRPSWPGASSGRSPGWRA